MSEYKVGSVVTVGNPGRCNVTTYSLCPKQYKTKNGRKLFVVDSGLPYVDPAVKARVEQNAAVHAMVVGTTKGRIAERVHEWRNPSKEWKTFREVLNFVRIQVQGGSGRAIWVTSDSLGGRQEKLEGNVLYVKDGGWRKPNLYYVNGAEVGSEQIDRVRKVALERSPDHEDLVRFILPENVDTHYDSGRLDKKRQEYIKLYRDFVVEVHQVQHVLKSGQDYWPHWWDLEEEKEDSK